MHRIGPGFYVDGVGAMHFDAAEMCEYARVPITRENIEVMSNAAIFTLQRRFPGALIAHVDHEHEELGVHGRD